MAAVGGRPPQLRPRSNLDSAALEFLTSYPPASRPRRHRLILISARVFHLKGDWALLSSTWIGDVCRGRPEVGFAWGKMDHEVLPDSGDFEALTRFVAKFRGRLLGPLLAWLARAIVDL